MSDALRALMLDLFAEEIAAEKEAVMESIARKMILAQEPPETIMYYTELPYSKLEEIAASENVSLTNLDELRVDVV